MRGQRRRDVRYAIRFPAQLTIGKRTQTLTTADVSFGGVFLRTDTPPSLQQLVSVDLVLPIGDRALSAHGMTVRVVRPDDPSGYDAGIGVQFYALDQATRDAWDAFIHHVEERFPPSADQAPLKLPRGFTPEPVRRRFERHTAVLRLTPETQADLDGIHRRLSSGSLSVPSPLELPTGAPVIVCIDHPESGHPFLFEGTIKDHTPGPPAAFEVAWTGASPRRLEDFSDFVKGGIRIDDEVLVPASE